INRTETAVGSGNQYLMDLQVGGSSKFNVQDNGYGTFSGWVSALGFQVYMTSVAYSPTGSTSQVPNYLGTNVSAQANLDGQLAGSEWTTNNTNANTQHAYLGITATSGSTAWSPASVIGQSTGSSAYAE